MVKFEDIEQLEQINGISGEAKIIQTEHIGEEQRDKGETELTEVENDSETEYIETIEIGKKGDKSKWIELTIEESHMKMFLRKFMNENKEEMK